MAQITFEIRRTEPGEREAFPHCPARPWVVVAFGSSGGMIGVVGRFPTRELANRRWWQESARGKATLSPGGWHG